MGEVNGGQLVVDALKREGVEYIFSLSGGHINPIYYACPQAGIKVIDTRHEQAAAHMAEAWGRLTRKPGVLVVTAGPGFTDAITGIANAYQANTPMIVIAGRSGVSEAETIALQELEQIDIIRSLTKWSRVVYETRRIDEYVAMAFRHAMTGRPGPVFLEIPIDVLARNIDEATAVRPEGYRPEYKPGGSKEGIEEAIKLLKAAEKPVIIAGSGAHYAEAENELKAFAELTDIPVFTNLMGRGLLPDDHSHCLGSAMPAGLGIFPSSDLVLVLGARLGLFLAQGKAPLFPAETKMIQVDIDGGEIGRNRKIDLGIVGDIKEVLKGFIEQAGDDSFSNGDWLESAQKMAEGSKLFMTGGADLTKEEPIHPARLMQEINDFLDPDAVVAADGGDTQVWSMFTISTYRPGNFLFSGVFGCLGVGIPFGLAAKLRFPDKQVLVTMGDGSAGLNLMEFNTAIRFNLPIVMVISNDSSWGMIRHSQKAVVGPENLVACELGDVAYEKVVEALGGYGERVDRAEDIRPALERAFASGKPACLNVYTDRDVATPSSQMLADLGKE